MSNKYPGGIITSGAPAGYSVYCDGTGDYLQATTASLSGAFTVEFWYYRVGTGSNYCFTIGDSFTSTGIEVYIGTSGTVFNAVYIAGVAQLTSTTQLPTANAWTHIALVRDGSNVIRCYLNGTQVTGSYTSSATFNNTVRIGAEYYNGSVTGSANAYFSNFRIVNGTALYTAAFTPPTQLFAVTNTSLLTCNSPAIVDQSSNAFTITANGNAAVSTFTPFQGYVAYNPALGAATPGIWSVSDAIQAAQTRRWNMYDPYFNLTTLLLHGNGTNGAQNNTFLDSSSNNFTITRNGNTTQGTFSPFSQTGWSNYFNGSSDYLTTNSSTALNLSTNDFTVECFVNVTTASNQVVIAGVNAAAGTGSWQLQLNYSSAQVRFFCKYGGGNALDLTFGTGNIPANAWNHIAVTRSGANLRVFLNGTQIGTTNTTLGTSSIDAAGANYKIGQTVDAYPGWYLSGYLSNIRVVIGTALYTSNFTPNTTPLTAVTNTALLTCQSNRFIDNSTNALTLTPTGSPSVQAFSPFYPLVAYTPQAQGGSGYFDGTGDFLSAASNTAFAFGTGDFTWEAWVYRAASAASQELYTTMVTNGFIVYISSNKAVVRQFGVADRLTSSADVTLNTWTHIAVARSGTTLSLWLNGSRTSGGTVTNSDNFAQSGIRIGINDIGTSSFTGYISGMRVVKGTAVYDPTQTSITVPTAPPTAVTNTSLLLNYTNAGIIDSTGDNVLETVGNAQISTAQSKFGGSSMSFDGTGDWAIAPANPMFNLGTSDFTIECWIYFTTTSSAQYFLGTFAVSPNRGWFAYFDTTLKLSFTYSTTGSNAVDAGFGYTPPTNTWVHIAFVRSGANLICYANGAQQGSTHNIGTSSIFANTQPLYIGERGSATGAAFNGYIDDLRITRFARYTGNFTPQTSQWQDQ